MFKPILIGSRALAFWDDTFKLNPNADWDVISDAPIDGFEWHDPKLLNNYEVEYFTLHGITKEINGISVRVASITGLALIKRSHLWRNLSFDKHITMYHRHLARCVEGLTDFEQRFLNVRTELTHKTFPQGHPSLMKSKEDFFDDFVTKKYDHDELHKIVAFSSEPMYNKILKDNEPVFCDRAKWELLSHEQKLQCIAEETYVIAIERFLVPNDWKYPAKLAYIKSLNKVCTTLCSGWFRDYAIDHYPELFELFDATKFLNCKERIINDFG